MGSCDVKFWDIKKLGTGAGAPYRGRSVAEALVTVTIALTASEPDMPDPKVLRQAPSTNILVSFPGSPLSPASSDP